MCVGSNRIGTKAHDVLIVSLLKLYYEHSTGLRNKEVVPEPAVMGSSGEAEYVVGRTLDSRRRRGKIEYLVNWRGYPTYDSNRTWEPTKSVKAARLRKSPTCMLEDEQGVENATSVVVPRTIPPSSATRRPAGGNLQGLEKSRDTVHVVRVHVCKPGETVALTKPKNVRNVDQ